MPFHPKPAFQSPEPSRKPSHVESSWLAARQATDFGIETTGFGRLLSVDYNLTWRSQLSWSMARPALRVAM